MTPNVYEILVSYCDCGHCDPFRVVDLAVPITTRDSLVTEDEERYIIQTMSVPISKHGNHGSAMALLLSHPRMDKETPANRATIT